jgi:hypothetical protein
VIGLVDGLGDVGRTDAVAYLTDERGASTKSIHIGTVGTLAKSTDDGLAGNEHLVAVLILADDTIGSNPLTHIFGMGR